MQNNNNSKLPYHTLRIASLLLLLALAHSLPQSKSNKHSNQIQDLSNLTLHHQEQSYHLPITINHHTIKMHAELQSGRTWLKEALCKICDIINEHCNASCFTDKQAPKISCDSSFCSQIGKYSDEARGIFGKQAQVFAKIGDNAQVLLPLIMANKLYQERQEGGEFNIFDAQASFRNGMISRTPLGSIDVYNLNKMQPKEIEKMRQKEGTPINITMVGEQFEFSFLKAKKVILHHVENASIADFADESSEYQIVFSLQNFAINIPLKLAKKLQKYLDQTYFKDKKCRLIPRKLKCGSGADMQQVFKTVFHFQLNDYQFPIPLHLLITACSSNECNTLINFDQSSQNTLTFGYVIWELYNLQYSLDKKYAVFYRRTTQFDDLFLLDQIKLSKVGFLTGLLLIIYHSFRYILIALFWLAIFSLVVNFIMRWRSLLGWFRDLLVKRKKNRVLQNEDQHFQERPFRRINKLPNPFEDSETI